VKILRAKMLKVYYHLIIVFNALICVLALFNDQLVLFQKKQEKTKKKPKTKEKTQKTMVFC